MAGDRVLRYSRAYAKGYFATVLLVHSQQEENSYCKSSCARTILLVHICWAVFDIARKSAKMKPAYAREQRPTKCTSWNPHHQLFTSRFSSMSFYSARRGALEEVLLSPSLFDEPVLSPYL